LRNKVRDYVAYARSPDHDNRVDIERLQA